MIHFPAIYQIDWHLHELYMLINIIQTVSLGAYCESPGKSYDGQHCEYEHATCGGYVQDCHGRSVGSAPHASVVC